MNFKQLLLKIMKLTFYGIFIQCLFLNFLFASEMNAQEQTSVREVFISLHLQNVAVSDAFRQIESKTDFTFSYDLRHIENKLPINLNAKNKSVAEILLEISEQADLKFKQVNNNINVETLSPKNRKAKKLEVIIQTRTVTGKVTSFEDEEGIPGVNVLEKGTNNGTVTDVQGNYSLEVSEGATIVFSSVGYTTEEVEVGSRSVIDLAMMQDLKQLQELVVIGYGQQRKEDLSGSVVSVDAKTLEKIPNTSFEQAMQGRVPGVQITQSSNAPGGGISVRIRGGNSITGGNEPLYVVDGVQINANNEDLNPSGNNDFTLNKDPAGNALASLNPQDIESIEVLKDASATAIYGSRGSNGVVLITTKQGTTGQSTFSYESFYSMQEAATRYDAMNRDQYLNFYNDIEINRTARDDDDNEIRTLSPALTSQFVNTDWQDEIFNPALMQSQTFRFAGGSKDLSYNASFNYFDQNGVVESTGFKRYSLRLNTNGQVNDKISFGNSFTFTNSTRNAGIVNGNGFRGDDIVMAALQSPPIQPVRDANGFLTPTTRAWQNALEDETGESFLFPLGRTQNTLLTARESVNDITINRVLGNIFGQLEITDGLRFKVSVGGDFADATKDYFLSNLLRSSDEEGFAVKSTRRNISLINTNTVHYDRAFNGNTLNLMGGFEVQTNRNESLRASATNFFTNTFANNALQAGNEFNQPNTGLTEWSLMSFFARGNYIFKDRYIFTATVRTDGSCPFWC